jgi:hypothetical protein
MSTTLSLYVCRPKSVSTRETRFSRDNHFWTEGVHIIVLGRLLKLNKHKNSSEAKIKIKMVKPKPFFYHKSKLLRNLNPYGDRAIIPCKPWVVNHIYSSSQEVIEVFGFFQGKKLIL